MQQDNLSENTTELLTSEMDLQKRIADNANARCGKLNLSDGYDCEICKNRGYINEVRETDGTYETIQKNCKCLRVRRGINNIKHSGLANVLHLYRMDNFVVFHEWQKNVYQKVSDYIAHGGNNWLFLGGASGAGKTHLCSAVAIELSRSRVAELKYIQWRDEVRRIKGDNFEGGNLINVFKSVDILYIDDFFKSGKGPYQEHQRPSAADIGIAFDILNSRAVQHLTTIISTECTFDELMDIDEAIAGRIKQMCGTYFVNISKGENKNYRLTAPANFGSFEDALKRTYGG